METLNIKKIYRNGDWVICQVKNVNVNELKNKKITNKKSFVFGEGEQTGHLHIITVQKPQDMILTKMPNGSYLVELKDEATITHPEHSLKVDIKIKKGTYKLFQKREKDWFSLSTRKIVD